MVDLSQGNKYKPDGETDPTEEVPSRVMTVPVLIYTREDLIV